MDYTLPEIRINIETLRKFWQGKFLIYCAVFLLVVKIFSIAVFINFAPNIFFADVTKSALVNFVNQNRKTAGVGGLSENIKLDQAAGLKAEDMVAKEYFSHNSPDGISPWHWFSEIGYDYKYAGENLAIGFFDSKDVFQAWLNSPPHKENLLNPKYQEIGTAVLQGFGPNNAVVVVQLFGTLKTPQNLLAVPEQTKTSEKIVQTPAEKSGAATASNEPIKNNFEEPNKEVMSEYSENISFFEKITGNSGDNFYLKLINFVSYEHTEFLQYLIYIFLLISAVSAVSSLYMSQQKQRREFLFRSFLVFAILLSAMLLNREILYLVFPTQIII